VGIGAFSGGETVIGFDSLSEDEVVTTQFLPLTVDFSGSSHVSGSTSAGVGSEAWFFFAAPGTAVLQNFADSCGASPSYCLPVVIDFTIPYALIGFDLVTNPGMTTVTVTLTSAGVSTPFLIPTGSPESFVGFFDPSGIDQIVISGAPLNGAIGLDDLRFEAPIPEPGTLSLLGAGILGLAALRRRRRI